MRKLARIQGRTTLEPARSPRRMLRMQIHGCTRGTLRTLSAHVSLCALTLATAASATARAAPDVSWPVASSPLANTPVLAAHGQLGPGENMLYVGLQAPVGARLTPGSPVEIRASGRGLSFPERVKARVEPGAHIPVPVKISPESSGQADFRISYYWCHESEAGSSGQCVREIAQVRIQLDVSGDQGGGEAYFNYRPALRDR